MGIHACLIVSHTPLKATPTSWSDGQSSPNMLPIGSLPAHESLIVLLTYIDNKNYFKFLQQHGLFKANKPSSRSSFRIGTAERKVLIVFCYYMVLAVVALTTFTISTRNDEVAIRIIAKHFICEQSGFDPEGSCDRSRVEEQGNPVWTTMSYILLGIFPIVNLIYAVNIQELKEHCLMCSSWKKKLLKSSVSDNPSTFTTAVNSKKITSL